MGGSVVNKIHMGGSSVIIEILGGRLVNCRIFLSYDNLGTLCSILTELGET